MGDAYSWTIGGVRSRSRITNSKYFNIDHRTAEENDHKRKKDTPSKSEQRFGSLEKPKNNFLSMSAKERVEWNKSEMNAPNFGNDKCKSQMSDGIEFHPLTQMDDFDFNKARKNEKE